jgi:spore maturation protein CgeB
MTFYDCVFTTKSYHGDCEQREFSVKEFQHVRHGFDPEVHRPVTVSAEVERRYACDVSFVGCWSPEKERRILHLLRNRRNLIIKVFGRGWNYSSREFKGLLGSNLRAGVYGDELSVVYRASKVNLGLLSSSRDCTRRDQTTARTFQIPAAGAFMIHEDTPEVRSLFLVDEEVVLFNNDDELIQKIDFALQNSIPRNRIAERGYQRCHIEPYDYSSAANAVQRYFEFRTGRSSEAVTQTHWDLICTR